MFDLEILKFGLRTHRKLQYISFVLTVYCILLFVSGYIIGSIPTGYIAGRLRGVDLRHAGSGNIGATNAFRVLGKTTGTIVLLIDMLKGLAAACLPPLLPALAGVSISTTGWWISEYDMLIGGFAGILGHIYTFWLGFKGGKGIATTAGVFVALMPMSLIIVLAIWGVILAVTRYVSLASIAAAVSLPLLVWWFNGSPAKILVTTVISLVAIWKHKGNIKRLLQGNENRVTFKRKKSASKS
ncbi:MAG: glycerol-3-phosphate 1-O-acyltransferase PlsY [Verrucomicrobia bacterium]|nr:glycerol-3-phosphate 1-O-acyltransferase PlsY [Verrucomicrobiota bacterium]MCF7707754.1 glycerol-3-phosphate 1-O-acyltransferase PlsY [Verrucomicrobiota bacterium]